MFAKLSVFGVFSLEHGLRRWRRWCGVGVAFFLLSVLLLLDIGIVLYNMTPQALRGYRR